MPTRFNAADLRWVAAWFLIAIVLRSAVVGLLAGMLERDPDGYRQLAENVVGANVFGFRDGEEIRPTAFRPPLYPLLLTATIRHGSVSLPAVAILHVVLGAMTVACVWLIARLMQLRWGSHLAALIVLVDPILLAQSAQLMTETLAALFAVAVLLTLILAARSDRFRLVVWGGAGLLLGGACLCRPTFLLSTAFILGAMLLSSHSRKWSQVAVVALAASVPVLLWTARNTAVFGRPVIATTHGGYTMLLGNNADFYRYLRSPGNDVWRAAALDQRLDRQRVTQGWDELQYDRATAAEARTTITKDPTGFLRAATYRLTRLFAAAPNKTDPKESPTWQFARLAVTNWYIAVLGLAAFGCLGRFARGPLQASYQASDLGSDVSERWAWRCMLAFVLSFIVLHTIYWCDMRMRAPLAPLIALAAAWGGAQLRELVSSWKQQAAPENEAVSEGISEDAE